MPAPKAKPKKYLVVVKYPIQKPPTQTPGVEGFSLQSHAWTAKPNICKTVTASSAEDAAEAVGVPAGATVHVVLMEHVQTFTRPEKAPLVAA